MSDVIDPAGALDMARITKTGAIFGEGEHLRYFLWRNWDADLPAANFIGLNPSTADEEKDDPTIRRCVGFARDWGFGALWMTNIFAFRATDPNDLRYVNTDVVGPYNDEYLLAVAKSAGIVVCAWGGHRPIWLRDRAVKKGILRDINAYCLGRTASSAPRHPLYVAKSALPVPYP